ncbi:MAG TPA: DUF1707 domain-containing protein [Acidimicrobiales bacterium]|jgi:hypothetical protein|nr:DUF1707 domain-containing protein [Acidimicrobiales bacterium]
MSDMVPQPMPTTRASDADRDRVLQVLATATADGRLTVDEHSELTDKALQARTIGELDVLTQDLGTLHAAAPAAPPAPLAPAPRRGFLAIFGAKSRKGGWHVPTEFKATAIFGAVELDFREARFDAPEVVCVANCVFGAVEITVPDWVRVVDEGTAIFGAREEAGPSSTEPTVTLHLRGFSVFGATEVRRKAPKLKKGPDRTLPEAPTP